jgi:thioredoxin-related protein
MKLENEIWSTEEFKSYASTHYVMLKADFPKRSKNALSPEQQEKNNKLADTYNKNGYFPFVVLLDKSGKVLGTLGYKNVSPKEYLELIESFLK